ncbi:AraC family transcriptional regulator ligand-binding domain-containing protein [Phenylobacterium montanum]|nr:AraC family transcriptional regulator ligand-binding domain-containing protein [Caulobacter sp. S6]
MHLRKYLHLAKSQVSPADPAEAAKPHVRGVVLIAFSQAAMSLGLDWEAIAAQSGLPPETYLDTGVSVPGDAALRAINLVAALSGREDIGIRAALASKAVIGSFLVAPLRIALRAQPTLGAGIRFLAKHIALQDPGQVHEVHEVGQLLVWKRRFTRPELNRNPHLMTVLQAASVLFLRDILGADWRPHLTCFSRTAPEDIGPFQAFFGKVEFGCEGDSLVLDRADANLSLPHANPEVLKTIEEFVTARGRPDQSDPLEDLQDVVLRLLIEGDCSLQRLAAEQGVDPRTIHRRLKAHGTTFSDLLDRARRSLVESQMGRADQPLSELAAIVGFSSVSTFSRWFHDAYGMTASEYRRLGASATDQERAKALMDRAIDVVLGVDRAGRVRFCNQAVQRLGFDAGRLIGANLRDLVHPDAVISIQSLLRIGQGAEPSNAAAHLGLQVRRADGTYQAFGCHTAPIFDREGRLRELLIVLRQQPETCPAHVDGSRH